MVVTAATVITLRLLPSSGDLIVSAARPTLDETPSAGSLHVRVARACVEALCRASLPGSAADSWTRAQLCLWRVALLGSCPMDARELLEGLQELDTQVESALTMLNTTLDTAASASAEPDSRETATARDGAARYGATAAAIRSGARDGALATLAAASLALDQLIQGARDSARDGAVNESNLKLVLDGLARTAGSLTAGSLTAESFEERRRPAINTAISTAINTAGRASARFLSVLAPELVSSAAAEVSSRPVVSSTAEDVSGLAERLMSDMCELFREYADEAGHVGRHELIEIGSAPRFAELSAKTALLGRVDLSCSGPLGAHDDARLAFWLNVYNLICMQGFAANARQVPCSESTLAVLRMHSSFVHNIGGFSISAIEIEHAILRASKPRPSFFIAFLIPKFGSNDPRRALAFSSIPSPLISFGLVAGTVFSPPLRAYTAGAVHTQLALNARAVLAMTIEVLDTTPSSSTCRFPRWHASAHHGATSLFPTGARPDALPAPPVAPRAAPLAPRRRGRLRARRTHRPGAPPAAAAAHRGAPRSLLGRRARDGARDGGQDAVEQHVMARALRVCARRRGVCMSTYEREISERCLDSRGAWSCRRVQPTARTTPATRRAASPCLPPRVRSSQSAYLLIFVLNRPFEPRIRTIAESTPVPFRFTGPSRPDTHPQAPDAGVRRDAGEASVGAPQIAESTQPRMRARRDRGRAGLHRSLRTAIRGRAGTPFRHRSQRRKACQPAWSKCSFEGSLGLSLLVVKCRNEWRDRLLNACAQAAPWTMAPCELLLALLPTKRRSGRPIQEGNSWRFEG